MILLAVICGVAYKSFSLWALIVFHSGSLTLVCQMTRLFLICNWCAYMKSFLHLFTLSFAYIFFHKKDTWLKLDPLVMVILYTMDVFARNYVPNFITQNVFYSLCCRYCMSTWGEGWWGVICPPTPNGKYCLLLSVHGKIELRLRNTRWIVSCVFCIFFLYLLFMS